ncbi:hypothetical protein ACLRGF_12930 [Mycetocola zhadangensis]|uniref:hypothetical protein n=1 Tax=Mycetocola zhadangensis TaxID=1164595 RepID=UPI003A4D453C
MSNTPPDHEAGRSHRPRSASKRMLVGLVFFGLGLLLVAAGVVAVFLSMVNSTVIGVIAGLVGAVAGIVLNFTGLVLLYRAITGSAPQNPDASDDTP